MKVVFKNAQEGQGCVFKKVVMVDRQTAFKSPQRTMNHYTAKRIMDGKR